MMYFQRRTLFCHWLPLLACTVAIAAAAPATAQRSVGSDARASQSATTPLDSLLNPDGTVRLDAGFSGSLDPSGFRMVIDPEGAPRFMRDASGRDPRLMAADTLDSMFYNYPGDEYWSEAFGPPGIDGPVSAMLVAEGELYVGGRFTITGNTIAYNISCWNGRKWRPLSSGVNGQVLAMTYRAGILYVGGTFTTAGPEEVRGIARYIIAQDVWKPLGWGVGTDGGVSALAFIGTDLYVGGGFRNVFTRAGSQKIMGLARWNGTFWEELPGGPNGFATGFAVRDTELYVIGGFGTLAAPGYRKAGGIACWDGHTWTTLDSGTTGEIRSVVIAGDDLYVGGRFIQISGVPAMNVARWSFTGRHWYPVGNGLGEFVDALAHDGRYLYAGGRFESPNGLNAVARFDGTAWQTMAGGMSDTVEPVSVNAFAVAPEGLYAGGNFIIAGSVSAHHIARWDGERWHALAQGGDLDVDFNGTSSSVYAMAADRGKLYVGGDFLKAGGIPARRVAMWDGEEWSALGGGIGGQSGFVRALAVAPNGDLYVGGIFDEAGGVRAHGIARWDGTAWHDVSGGVGGPAPYVFALLSSGDLIYAGGAFTEAGARPAARVARYSTGGHSWAPLGEGIGGDSSEYVYVTSLAEFNGDIYIGGDFARAGGERARRIARWDGQRWHRLADRADSGANGRVSAMAVYRNQLYVGGAFTAIGDTVASRIASFDGAIWHPVFPLRPLDDAVLALKVWGGNLIIGGAARHAEPWPTNYVFLYNGDYYDDLERGVNSNVNALAELDGVLYAGGDFTMAGPRKAAHIAAWDSVVWTALGSDPTNGVYGLIRTVSVHGTDVYVGGAFSAIGGVRARNVAKWDGARWSALGRGRRNGVNGTVLAIAVADSDVFVGGAFTAAGDQPIGYLARWNGESWSNLGAGVSGNNPYVFALLADGDNLFAGGGFMKVGAMHVGGIARWSRSAQQWFALDSGISGGSYYTYVSGLAGRSASLDVGGNFALAGHTPTSNVAHWDGTSWSAFGPGVNGSVYEVARYRGDLYACGDFTAAGKIMTRNIARWNGQEWLDMEGGLNLPATDMTVYDDELYVSGHFQMAGTILGFGVARWNGQTWYNLGKGVQHGYVVGSVYGIDANDSGVFVGGDFTVAGGKASYYFGRWYRPAGTAGVAQPVALRPASGASIALIPNPATADAAFATVLPRAGQVTIHIVDARGDTRATLNPGILPAGPNRVGWNPEGLPNGHYIARIHGDGFEANTLILIQR